jgi:hypothetical protein
MVMMRDLIPPLSLDLELPTNRPDTMGNQPNTCVLHRATSPLQQLFYRACRLQPNNANNNKPKLVENKTNGRLQPIVTQPTKATTTLNFRDDEGVVHTHTSSETTRTVGKPNGDGTNDEG